MAWSSSSTGERRRASVTLAVAAMATMALAACGDDGGGGDGSGGSDGFSLPGTGASSGTGAGSSTGSGTGVGSGGEYETELAHCVDVINGYRSENGRSAVTRSADLEACAMAGAEEDAQTGNPHGHFQSTNGCGGVTDAENEVPGWPLSQFGTVTAVVDAGAQLMMDEGPGGGHYENILGDHTAVGCGIFVTAADEVWIVHDFK